MILLGYTCVCIAAILFAIKPTTGTCISRAWLNVLGNTLMVVPLIVKVAAINKVCQAATRMRRFSIKKQTLYKATAAITLFFALYLLVWTLVDPNTLQTIMNLTNNKNEYGGQVVEISYYCASESSTWVALSFIFQFLLCAAATVLAFQNQNVVIHFNESFWLAMVVYAHSLFTALVATLWILRTKLDSHIVSVASSYLLSFDALAGLTIYFLPKVNEVFNPNTTDTNARGDRRMIGFLTNRNAEITQQSTQVTAKLNTNANSIVNDSNPLNSQSKSGEVDFSGI